MRLGATLLPALLAASAPEAQEAISTDHPELGHSARTVAAGRVQAELGVPALGRVA